jgi:hypothetical protein
MERKRKGEIYRERNPDDDDDDDDSIPDVWKVCVISIPYSFE